MADSLPTGLSSDPHPKTPLTGIHVFFWLSGFFAFMFVVNGIFLYTALTTHPGEAAKHAYLTGLDYNDALASRAVQQNAGWRAAIGLASAASVPVLEIRLMNAEGEPLEATSMRVTATERSMRHTVRLFELEGTDGARQSYPAGRAGARRLDL